MKNLKRLLSLVVVMAVLCSLPLTVSAADAADYTDTGDITYYEAVDVLTSIGVLEGLTDGSYGPDQTMTRSEAAKIIAYLVLGDSAENLSAVTAPFDDVAADHWAAGYIAYCANAGIIDGDGNGSFLPEEEVTAYQFGKMLLTAVGYGVNGEYTGSGWEISVASDASALDIYDGLEGTLSGSEPMTRDEMAIYAFNTLVGVAQVNYNSVFGEYYIGTSALTAVDNDVDPTDEDSAFGYTLGCQNFGLLKVEANDTDAFGRPYYYWTQDGAAITDGYTSSTADYVYEDGVTQSTLYSDLGRTVATGYYFSYIVDGVTLDETDGPTRSSSIAVGYVDGVSDGADTGTYAEVYVDDENQEVTVIIINTYLGQITDVDDDDPDEIVYTVDVFDDGELNTSLDITTDDDSFAKDDYVLVTAASEDGDGEYELQSIVLADYFTGAVTTYGSYYTDVDDVTYYHSIKYDYQDDYIASGDDFDSVYTFYQDSYGNIIGAELYSGSASSGNYLYLSDSYASYYSALYGEAYVAAAVTFVDGTEDVIYLRVTNSTSATSAYFYNPDLESTYYIRSGAASGTSSPVYDDNNKIIAYEGYGDVIDAGWYSYTVNSSGYYTLSELDTDVAGTATGVTTDDDTTAVKFDTDNNSSVDKTLYANSSTELVLVDSGLVYTGYTNFPSADYGTLDDPSDTDVSVLYVTNSGGRLTDIYVLGTGSTTVDVTFAVYRSSVGTTADGSQYSFYVDGSYSTYLFASADSLTRYTSVGFLLEDSDGYYSFVDASNASTYGYDFTTGIVLDADDDFVEVWVDSNNDDTQDSDEVYYFALAEDAEVTRITGVSSASHGTAREGDTVYVFSDELASGEYSAEAYAVFAVDEDLVSDTDEDENGETTTYDYAMYLSQVGANVYSFAVDGDVVAYEVSGGISNDTAYETVGKLVIDDEDGTATFTAYGDNDGNATQASAKLTVESAARPCLKNREICSKTTK